ncbi:MAG: gluconate 2-dehydrogenase subunit 3 family protein [Pseudomonadota bacterium]
MGDSTSNVTRRTAIVAFATTGVMLSYPSLGQALVATPAGTSDSDGVLLDRQAMRSLAAMVDTVLPETETPGGLALDVPGFVDLQLFACHSEREQRDVASLIDTFTQVSVSRFGRSPMELTTEEREQLVSWLDQGASPFTTTMMQRFRFLKHLMVFGYFTSKRGATEVLKFDAIPGGFKGSVPYKSVGSAWGSLAFY